MDFHFPPHPPRPNDGKPHPDRPPFERIAYREVIVGGPIGPQGPKGDKGDPGTGLQIDGTVNSLADLPKNPSNGDAYFVGASEPRTLYVYDESSGRWISQGLLKGEKGDKGDPGTGLQIDGTVNTVDELPTNAQNGDSYLVGYSEPRTLFIYDTATKQWINQGTLSGGVDGTVKSIADLPKNPTNGDAFFVGTSEPRELFIYDEASGQWIDHGSLKGEKGDKGDPGTGLEVKGSVDSFSDLPDNPIVGDAYFVGETEPRELYIYDGVSKEWVSQGTLKGEKGDTGATGPAGAEGNCA